MWSRRQLLIASAALALPPLGAQASEGQVAPRSRQDWAALPARPGGRPHQLRGLALHHSAGRLVGSAHAPEELRSIQVFHQQKRGWVDVAYHLFVDADGQAWLGRDRQLAGDSSTRYDTAGWLLICCLGNFEERQPPLTMLEGLRRLVRSEAQVLGLDPCSLQPHQALAATLCPGRHLWEAMRSCSP